MLILCILTAFYFMWVGTWLHFDNSPLSCADYGIKITSPSNDASVGGEIAVSGSFGVKPTDGSLLLMVKSPDGSEYWPSSDPVQLNETLQSWSGKVYIFGEPPKRQEIIAVIVSKSGRALYEYYVKVGKQTGNWQPIEMLTDDVLVCDVITVEKK